MKMLLLAISTGLLLCTAAAATDLTGIWSGQVPARFDLKDDITFEFKQKGSTLTGKLYGDNQDLVIEEGKVEGDRFSFVIKTEGYGGAIRFLYTGKTTPEGIELTRRREDVGTRVGRKREPQVITLKKML
ncbi:MAG: hypothetical protein ACK5AZ_07375 [Bryobacteraceae bacterium]